MSKVVTQLEKMSSNRYKVYLDGQFAFVLYRGELSSLHLKENSELSDEMYHRILEEILLKRAKKRCLHLLEKRPYTEKRLTDKLREGGYPESVILPAVDYVKDFGYVDDFAYACQYLLCHRESESRRRLTEKLRQRGIDSQTLEKAWASCCDSEEEQKQREREQIRKLLRKKGYGEAVGKATAGLTPPAGQERKKLYLYLMRKGFSAEMIGNVLMNEPFDSEEE